MGGFELAVGVTKLDELIATWRTRCKALADEGKFWEAGRLSEAANELSALVQARRAEGVITTDKQVKDAYDQVKKMVQPTQWPPYWPTTTQPFYPLDGTRITD